jgi:hypothetical protein
LFHVKYEDFERCIKRFGWTGDLEDPMFEEVSDEIRIKVEDLEDKRSITHFFLQNKSILNKGKYNTLKVLMVGFLFTKHANKQKAGDDLWTILNPEIEETVSRDQVRTFLTEICSFATDPHLQY